MAPVVFSRRLHANYELVMLSWWVGLNLFTFACHKLSMFWAWFRLFRILFAQSWMDLLRNPLGLPPLFYLSHLPVKLCASFFNFVRLSSYTCSSVFSQRCDFKLSLWSFLSQFFSCLYVYIQMYNFSVLKLHYQFVHSRNIQLSLGVLLLGVGIATVTDLQLNVLGSVLSLLAVFTTCVAQIVSSATIILFFLHDSFFLFYTRPWWNKAN